MQENEVTPEEIKAFMNEPEVPAEAPKAPEPMGMDDWEPADGRPQDYKLTTEQIAGVAYRACWYLDFELNGGQTAMQAYGAWGDAEPHIVQHYIGLVNFFMNSAANPNGHESCQALHDLMLDAKMHDGWKWGENYSETDKTDPTLLSYKGLPEHLKARNFLFRCVVIGLRAVWKGH